MMTSRISWTMTVPRSKNIFTRNLNKWSETLSDHLFLFDEVKTVAPDMCFLIGVLYILVSKLKGDTSHLVHSIEIVWRNYIDYLREHEVGRDNSPIVVSHFGKVTLESEKPVVLTQDLMRIGYRRINGNKRT